MASFLLDQFFYTTSRYSTPPSVPPIAPADRLPTSNLPEFESGPSRLLLLHPPSAILAPSIGGFGLSCVTSILLNLCGDVLVRP